MLRVWDSARLGLGSVDSVSESTQSRLVLGQQVQLGSTRFLTARLSSTWSTQSYRVNSVDSGQLS
ncbi:hypothetical protein HanIR_Chr03g0117181 [Helianthus annuus]|nr:hypothetical protein HanIR_Chr03g0117181 [Helianthus annuus]